MKKNKRYLNNLGSASAIVVIIIALVIIVAGMYLYKRGNVSRIATPDNSLTPSSTASNPQSPQAQTTANTASDYSDAALQNDLENAGTNLNNLDTESSNIDSGMNQQQVDPTQ